MSTGLSSDSEVILDSVATNNQKFKPVSKNNDSFTLAVLFTVFGNNTPWIWENLDNQTINDLLQEHAEIHRDPSEKVREKMVEELGYQIENNKKVKDFMDNF